MAVVYQYRVWCTTDLQYEYTWDTVVPTVCPINAAHGIDATKTSVVEQVGDSAPKTSDGKPIITANAFPGWAIETVVGAGDDPINGVGAGQVFQLSQAVAGDATVDFSFNDSVYLAAGGAMFSGALLGDYVDLKIYAPATATTLANPANTGNCNLVDVGGFNLITPAVGNGTHNVDLTAACLVPSSDETGYYDWDAPHEGNGTITASATPGTALYNLFDIQLDVVQFVTKVSLLGSGHVTLGIQNVKSKKLLPHWKGQCLLHNAAGTQALDFSFYLKLGRSKTV